MYIGFLTFPILLDTCSLQTILYLNLRIRAENLTQQDLRRDLFADDFDGSDNEHTTPLLLPEDRLPEAQQVDAAAVLAEEGRTKSTGQARATMPLAVASISDEVAVGDAEHADVLVVEADQIQVK